MGIIADDYYNQLSDLLPIGPAFDLASNSILKTFLIAWSQEFARIDARANTLINESDPRTNIELLADYERVFGLPSDCLTGIYLNLQIRHANLVTQMTSVGNQTPSYYVNLAASAGYMITITDFISPYVWRVNSALNTVTWFTVASDVEDSLGSWQNTGLECLINRYKPAHTQALFAYT